MRTLILILAIMVNSCGNDRGKGMHNLSTSDQTLSELKGNMPVQKSAPDSTFKSFWRTFTSIIKNKDREQFKKIAFDTLIFKGKTVGVNSFVESDFLLVFNDSLCDAIGNYPKVDFIESEMEKSSVPHFVLEQLKSGKCIEKIVNVTEVDQDPPGQIVIILKFIDTKRGFKFYGYDRIG
jgi:hypothetical protein